MNDVSLLFSGNATASVTTRGSGERPICYIKGEQDDYYVDWQLFLLFFHFVALSKGVFVISTRMSWKNCQGGTERRPNCPTVGRRELLNSDESMKKWTMCNSILKMLRCKLKLTNGNWNSNVNEGRRKGFSRSVILGQHHNELIFVNMKFLDVDILISLVTVYILVTAKSDLDFWGCVNIYIYLLRGHVIAFVLTAAALLAHKFDFVSRVEKEHFKGDVLLYRAIL